MPAAKNEPPAFDYFLGVDGGSSKTHAVLARADGRVVGFGQAGPGNHQLRGLQPAVEEIRRAAEGAFCQAGIPASAVTLGCFCLSGADLPEDFALLQAAIQPLSLARRVMILNDTLASLRAGLSRPWGVTVICGSGFNAAGRSPSGEEIVLPGLGQISGDWGGGGELSLEMIRQVMRAWDGRGRSTLLTRLVLHALDAPNEAALLSRLYHGQIEQNRLLALVPLLFDAAEAGDAVARDLVVAMGVEAGLTAGVLIHRLGMQGEDVEVVLGGSVFKGRGSLLVDTVAQEVHKTAPRARVKKLCLEPVAGAVFLALEALGLVVSPGVREEFERSLPGALRILEPPGSSEG